MALKVSNEKVGSLERSKLHYLSLNFLEEPSFGRARLQSELTDYWLDKKFEIGGLAFNGNAPQLTQAEIDRVPGAAAATRHVDKLRLEVCVRDGARIVIKPDEDRYWMAQGGSLTDAYVALKEDHKKNYEKLLCSLMPGGTSGQGSEEQPAANETTAAAETGDTGPPVEVDSLDKVKEAEKIEEELPSEVADISILRCASGKIYLLAKKDKLIPKHCQLGGFGTGAYVSTTDPAPGVMWNVDFDRSLVQIDDSTIRQDASSISTMSLYKLLITLEKTKRITEHRLIYIEAKRKEETEEDLDGFNVVVRSQQKFKMLRNSSGREEKPSGKNIFGRCVEAVEASPFLLVVFRWRFEKVGANLKVQKPYVVTKTALQLTKDKPLEVHFARVGFRMYHILSFIIIYYHLLSYTIIYYLSFSYTIIYYHLLSYIFIYYHILSYIIIYYHIQSHIIIYYIIIFHIIKYYFIIYFDILTLYYHILSYVIIY